MTATNDSHATDSPTPEYTPTADQKTYSVTGEMIGHDWPLLALLVADTVFAIWAMFQIGDAQVPVHWGIDGKPDQWGPGWMNNWLPVGLAWGLYFMMLFIPLLDPRRSNYVLFAGTMRSLRWVFALFAMVLHVPLVMVSMEYEVDVTFVIRLAIPVLFLVIGNNLGRMRPNYFVGIRVPWTLDNETVWAKTHRLAGRLWVGGSLVMIAAAFIPDPAIGFIVFMGIVLLITLIPIVYSAVIFAKTPKGTSVKPDAP